MAKREKITCVCGGEITRPIPLHCPHCGATIARVQYRWWSLIWPVLVILLMFAGLLGFLAWFIGRSS
jgi:hypothetical protein